MENPRELTKMKLDMEIKDTSPVFEETQKFTQWWLWLLMSFIVALTVGLTAYQLFITPIQVIPTAISGFTVFMMLGIFIMIATTTLTTYIDQHQIVMKYWPLGNKKVAWSEVESVEVINYGFVGYGKRLSLKYGWIYNVAGKYGLHVKLKNGKRFTIGTQKKEELEDFLGRIGRGLG